MAAAAAILPERGGVVMVEVAAEVAERGGMAPHRFPHTAEGVETSAGPGAQTAA